MNARFAGLILVGALVPLLAGCTPAGSPGASPSSSSSSSESPGASPSASGSPGASGSPSASPAAGSPVTEDCLDLVSLDTMYAFDPNFAYNDSFTPERGSLAATAVADGGVACDWIRETGGGEIVISVSKPGAEKLAALRSAAGSDTAFEMDGNRGVVQVFEGDAWITASSDYFGSAADAAALTDSVAAAIG